MSGIMDRLSGLEASHAGTIRTQRELIKELTAGADHFEVVDLTPNRQSKTIGTSVLNASKAITIANASDITVYLTLAGVSFTIERSSFLTLPVQTNQFDITATSAALNALDTQFGRPAMVLILLHQRTLPTAAGSLRNAQDPRRYDDRQGPAPLNVAVGVASTQVAAANSVRRRLILVNDSANVIYINPFGAPAAVGQGIRLNAAGGVFDDEGGTTRTINAISAVANSNLCVCEFSVGSPPAVV